MNANTPSDQDPDTPLEQQGVRCVWCSYDAGSSLALTCPECGAALEDRVWVLPLVERSDNLLAGAVVMVVAVGLPLPWHWLSVNARSVEVLLVLGAFSLAILSVGLMRSWRVWVRLRRSGRAHPQRWKSSVAGMLFAGQMVVLGHFQLAGTLWLWS